MTECEPLKNMRAILLAESALYYTLAKELARSMRKNAKLTSTLD